MREVKFRIWDEQYKELTEVVEILFDQYGGMDVRSSRRMGINAVALGPKTLMQSTGVKDKNGKEIFEGDILKWKTVATWHRDAVKFDDGMFFCFPTSFELRYRNRQPLGLLTALGCELIGNIYENPELLMY